MKDNGKMVLKMEEVLLEDQMELTLKLILQEVKLKELEFIFIQMDLITVVNLEVEYIMAKANFSTN